MKSKKILFLSIAILFSILFFYPKSASFAQTRIITIISPTGGERWQIGTAKKIDFSIGGNITGTSTLGIYLEGAPNKCIAGLPCPIRIKNILGLDSPVNWTVGLDANGRKVPPGQYILKIIYPWDDTSGTSPIHAEASINSPITLLAVPAPTPKPTLSPVVSPGLPAAGQTKTPPPAVSPTPSPSPTPFITPSIPSPPAPEKFFGLGLTIFLSIVIGALFILFLVFKILKRLFRTNTTINIGLPNQDLINYVKQSRSQGLTDEQIRQNLLSSGWSEEEINKGFNK